MPRTILSLLLLVLVTGCSLFGSRTSNELSEAQARWAVAALNDYSFRLSIGCFCGYAGQYSIEVHDGEVVSIESIDEPYPGGSLDPARLTVDDLFEVLSRAVDNGADEILAEYDAELGYPRSINIDYYRDAVDDEISYNLIAFGITR